MRSGTRTLLAIALTAFLSACAGARPHITFDAAQCPVSLSGVVLDAEGRPLKADNQMTVGKFHVEKTAFATLYSHLPLTSFDLSDELNRQVKAVDGDAVVNLEVKLMGSGGCFTLGLLQYTQIFPLFIGCAVVHVEGDIIKAKSAKKSRTTRKTGSS